MFIYIHALASFSHDLGIILHFLKLSFRTLEAVNTKLLLRFTIVSTRYITGMGVRDIMLRKSEGKSEDLTREDGKKETRKALTSRKD